MAENKPAPGRRRRSGLLAVILCVLAVAIAGFLFLRHRGRAESLYRRGELYMKANNSSRALAAFREAIKRDPRHLGARAGVVRALTVRKDFNGALAELETALKHGLDPAEAAALKSRVLSYRGEYRIISAGAAATAKLCDDIIAEDVDPAIKVLEESLPKSKTQAAAYDLLGDLYSQKARLIIAKWRIILRERDLARNLQKTEEVAQKDSEARALLPVIRSVEKSAVEAYTLAVEKDPEAEHPRIALAQYSLTAYVPKPEKAKAILEPLLQRKPPPSAALNTMAAAERLMRNYDKALEYVRALAEQEKTNPQPLILEAEILVEAGRWAEAGPLTEKLVTLRPKDPSVAYARGMVLLHENRPGDAANFLQNIFTDPKLRWPQARLALAQALLTQGNKEQAITAARRVLDDVNATLATNVRMQQEIREAQYQACMLLAAQSKIIGLKSAMEYATKAFGTFPTNPEALKVLKELYREGEVAPDTVENLAIIHAVALAASPNRMQDAIEVCKNHYEEFKSSPTKGVRLLLLMARLLSRKGDYREATEVYNQLLQLEPQKAEYAQELARLYVRLGRLQEARKLYETLFAGNPKDMRVAAGLVEILLRVKDVEAARKVVEAADREIGSEQARALLMAVYVQEGRLDEAVAIARAQVQANPNRAPAHVLLAELLWRQKNHKEAREAFDTALRLAPDYMPAFRRGLLDLQDGRPADAVALFRAAHERRPKEPALAAGLAVALQSDGKPQEAIAVLAEVLENAQPGQRGLDNIRWCLAVMRAAIGDAAAAVAESARMSGVEIGWGEDRARLLEALASAEEPVRTRAAMHLNQLLTFDGAGLVQLAMEQAEQVVKILPNEPMAACWRARLLDALGKHEEAVSDYQRIIQQHPKFALARTLLADSYERHGKAQEAIQVFEDALEVSSADRAAWIHLKLGKLYEEAGQLEECVANYQAAMARPGFAAVALNNLAWVYAVRRNDPTAALPLAERAARLAPSDPAVLDTFGWVLYLSGDNDKALSHLSRAKAGLPSNPTVRYHFGMALLKAGKTAEGKKELEEALAISRDFPEADEAMKALSNL